ncbi:MAG TPA: glycerophosphodiester phosphodiesterase [Mobilitalea sp.]|nr:glycerophosphodiester phosphodiesterase [Mobilitalea sp.]
MNLRKYYRNIMKSPNRNLIFLELTYKVFFIIFLVPLCNIALTFDMHRWGQSYITMENLPSFLTYPLTILLLFPIFIIVPLYILIKIATMISYCDMAGAYKKPSLLRILSYGFARTFRCLRSGNAALPYYSLLIYIFTNIPILIGITVYARMELSGGTSDALFVKGLIILGLIFISFIIFPGIFVIHFCIHEHRSFRDGMAHSKMLLKGRSLKTAARLIIFNLILIVVFFLFYYTILILAALLTYLFTDRSLVIPVFLSVYPKLNLTIAIFFSMVSFIANLNLISSLFQTYQEADFKEILPEDLKLLDNPMIVAGKSKHILKFIFMFIMAAGLYNFYVTVRNDSFYLKDALTGILISSHRGNSHVAPENTLPALENAIIADSDYAEIDIRQTKDGQIVLLHDENLWRTAGINRNIWDVTYDEIKDLDVGSWFGFEFTGTKIPTLEEALNLCKGKIKLNIEIKADGVNEDIEGKLIELIEQHNYEYQCVVSCTNYASLKRIKQLNDKIKTGLVMSAAYGNYFDREYVDYFSIRSGFITSNIVKNAHKAGKEIHAWTVNSANDIERMKSLGVDCIITDNPTLAKQILLRDDTSETFIELLNRMLYKKSFFSIVKDEN